jgi:hypothetical protein
MLKRIETLLKVGVGFAGCVAVIGLAQAAPTQLTAISDVKGDTSWQDIKGTSYTFDDKNHNGQINVGETVTFTVDMHKTFWGVHDFDALKFWIDSPSGINLATNEFRWDFDPTNKNATEKTRYKDSSGHWVTANDTSRPWLGGDEFFTFDYTFADAGVFDLTGSVMCSADLSGLTGISQAKLETNDDWHQWTENTHQSYKNNNKWLQGETEKYQIEVIQQPVPEPKTYAMMIVGLGLMGFMARRRNIN